MVRAARVGDAAAIAAINIASWEAAYRGIVGDAYLDRRSVDRRATFWAELLQAGRDPVLVAVGSSVEADHGADASGTLAVDDGGGQLLGYCGLSLPARDQDTGPETAEIVAIYVDPRRFRAGVGSLLMGRAWERITAAGHSEVILWVLSENTRARAFYARHGFTADGSTQWRGSLAAEEMRMRRAVVGSSGS